LITTGEVESIMASAVRSLTGTLLELKFVLNDISKDVDLTVATIAGITLTEAGVL
jgi:hypothetical protein